MATVRCFRVSPALFRTKMYAASRLRWSIRPFVTPCGWQSSGASSTAGAFGARSLGVPRSRTMPPRCSCMAGSVGATVVGCWLPSPRSERWQATPTIERPIYFSARSGTVLIRAGRHGSGYHGQHDDRACRHRGRSITAGGSSRWLGPVEAGRTRPSVRYRPPQRRLGLRRWPRPRDWPRGSRLRMRTRLQP